MTPKNAERFKELLIWITSIKASEDDFDCWDAWNNSWKEKILRVVDDRNSVTKDAFHHLQFCYEIAFSKLVDIGEKGDNFYESHICDCIAFYWKIPHKCIGTENVVGEVEWKYDFCDPTDIWPNLEDRDQ